MNATPKKGFWANTILREVRCGAATDEVKEHGFALVVNLLLLKRTRRNQHLDIRFNNPGSMRKYISQPN